LGQEDHDALYSGPLADDQCGGVGDQRLGGSWSGLCPDHGIDGFKRYVALAVLARNIHRIGAILWEQDKTRELRKTKYSDRDTTYKLAA